MERSKVTGRRGGIAAAQRTGQHRKSLQAQHGRLHSRKCSVCAHSGQQPNNLTINSTAGNHPLPHQHNEWPATHLDEQLAGTQDEAGVGVADSRGKLTEGACVASVGVGAKQHLPWLAVALLCGEVWWGICEYTWESAEHLLIRDTMRGHTDICAVARLPEASTCKCVPKRGHSHTHTCVQTRVVQFKVQPKARLRKLSRILTELKGAAAPPVQSHSVLAVKVTYSMYIWNMTYNLCQARRFPWSQGQTVEYFCTARDLFNAALTLNARVLLFLFYDDDMVPFRSFSFPTIIYKQTYTPVW